LDEVYNEGGEVLLLDAGDLFGQRKRIDQEQTRFLCEVTGSFGYDAIGLGEFDLNYGLKFLREMIEKNDLPFTNANVRDPESGETILPPYLLVERAGITFGICSVLDPEQRIITMAAKEPDLEVADPVATLRELVPQLREEADTVILLSHLGDRKTEEILREVTGIDIAVVGHSYRSFNSERVIGETALLSAVYEGRYIGRADVELDREGVVQAFSVEVVGLDESIADNPVMAEKVEQFKKHLEEFRLSLRGDHQPTLGSAKEEFLGERSCRKCHQDIWAKLRDSGHQSAFASLGEKGQAYNPDCLVCHVTGYLYKGGYDDRPPYNRLANVQCEACHGYGTQHARDDSWARLARESCVACHDEENSPEFQFAPYWERIQH
jgi:nucleotide-binding universal stress UspA family protein